jgi:hypothetical protein
MIFPTEILLMILQHRRDQSIQAAFTNNDKIRKDLRKLLHFYWHGGHYEEQEENNPAKTVMKQIEKQEAKMERFYKEYNNFKWQ